MYALGGKEVSSFLSSSNGEILIIKKELFTPKILS